MVVGTPGHSPVLGRRRKRSVASSGSDSDPDEASDVEALRPRREYQTSDDDSDSEGAFKPAVVDVEVHPTPEQTAKMAQRAARLEELATARQVSLLPASTLETEDEQLHQLQQLLVALSGEELEFAIQAMRERATDPALATMAVQHHVAPLLRAMHAVAQNLQPDTSSAKRPAYEHQKHTEGCARAQGYYFISSNDKRAKLTAGRDRTQAAKAITRHASRDTRRIARNVTSELMRTGIEDMAMEYNKFSQLKVGGDCHETVCSVMRQCVLS